MPPSAVTRTWSFMVAQEVTEALAAARSQKELWVASAGQARRLFDTPRFLVGLLSPDGHILHVPYRLESGGPSSGGAMPVPTDKIRSVLAGDVAGSVVDGLSLRRSAEVAGRDDGASPPWLVAGLRGANRIYGVLVVQSSRPGGVDPEQLHGVIFLARQTGLVLDRIEREQLWQRSLSELAGEWPDGLAVVDDADRVRLLTPGFWRTLGLNPPTETGIGLEAATLANLVAGYFAESARVRAMLLLPKERHREHLDFHRDGRAIALTVLPLDLVEYGVGRVLILHDRSKEGSAARIEEDILSMLSHELRTPLTGIKGYTQILRGLAPARSESQQQALAIVEAQADRLVRVVDSLFTAAEIDRGQLVLHAVPTNVAHLVREVVQALQQRSPIHRLRLEAPADLPPAVADPERIREVVHHLIDNAVKFSSAGGEITITVACRDDAIAVEVADPGIGIPPQHRERILERFYQVDRSSSRRFGGTGLGLYICRGIVEAHGGRIWVESQSDRGSTFGFSLPIAGRTDKEKESSST